MKETTLVHAMKQSEALKTRLYLHSFGLVLDNRQWEASSVDRYGFNGQEGELQIFEFDTHTNAEYWMYDTRLGRRWEIDPLMKYSPRASPYVGISGNPILLNDPLGLSAGNEVKDEVSGSYDSGNTAGMNRSTLPSTADDGQEVTFEYSSG